MPGFHRSVVLAIVLAGIALCPACPSHAARTDVVILQNGDHVTGEVKSLDRGLLKFKTDHMGTFNIEWEYVAKVTSNRLLEVELKSGQRYFGRITSLEGPGMLVVTSAEGFAYDVEIADTVRIAQLDEVGSLRDRLDGYVDLGYSSTRATDVTEWSFDAGVNYRDRIRLWELDFQTVQSDSGTSESGSSSLTGQQKRFFGNRWFWSGVLQFSQNDSQNLDLRTLLGGGLGRYLVQTNHQLFGLGTGIGYVREDLDDGTSFNSTEVILAFGYDAFRFDDPELDLSADLVVFPSLTVSGRVRASAEISLRYVLIDDFYAELSWSETYDNKPRSADAARRDYTVTTSLGYTF